MFKIQEIFATINGEGPNTGYVTTIVRFAYPTEVNQIHLIKPKGVPQTSMDKFDILKQIELVKRSDRVALMGYDPTINKDFPELCKLLKNSGYHLLLDTPGVVDISPGTVHYLSLSPKPGLHCHPDMLYKAQEYRFYISARNTKFYTDNINYYLPDLNERIDWTLLPVNINQEDIDLVIQYCLDNPKFRANIPLYRTFPTLDLNFSPIQKERQND